MEILKRIRKNESSRNEVIRELVRDSELKQKIKSYILNNSGDAADAETVFHDAIVAFVKTVFTRRDFELTSNLHSYFIGMARNIWMNELRKKKRNATVSIDQVSKTEVGGNHEKLLLKGERGRILQMILERMRKNCKNVLMFWAAGFKMEEIAIKMGYKNGGVAKKKKSVCMKELYGYLSKKPHIKERIRPV